MSDASKVNILNPGTVSDAHTESKVNPNTVPDAKNPDAQTSDAKTEQPPMETKPPTETKPHVKKKYAVRKHLLERKSKIYDEYVTTKGKVLKRGEMSSPKKHQAVYLTMTGRVYKGKPGRHKNTGFEARRGEKAILSGKYIPPEYLRNKSLYGRYARKERKDIVGEKRKPMENETIGSHQVNPPTQSRKIFEAFGGTYRLWQILKIVGRPYNRATIQKWDMPREKGGTGGLIPSTAWPDIDYAARMEGILLTSEDIDPRPMAISYFKGQNQYPWFTPNRGIKYRFVPPNAVPLSKYNRIDLERAQAEAEKRKQDNLNAQNNPAGSNSKDNPNG